jgi:hypothetical protein
VPIAKRVFLPESIAGAFDGVSFHVPGHHDEVRDFPAVALSHARSGPQEYPIQAVVSRQAIGRGLVRICEALAHMHRSGRMHGDLKPDNVLFTIAGPRLIDDHGVARGDIAPTWTPRWSAPEQIRGRPITEAADIHPVGLMIQRLIDADLLDRGGLLRVNSRHLPEAERVYYNPYLVRSAEDRTPVATFAAWAEVGARCLRYVPGERKYSAAGLGAAISGLLTTHPLLGDRLVEPHGRLVTARFPDGTTAAARLIQDRDEGLD